MSSLPAQPPVRVVRMMTVIKVSTVQMPRHSYFSGLVIAYLRFAMLLDPTTQQIRIQAELFGYLLLRPVFADAVGRAPRKNRSVPFLYYGQP